MKGEGRAVGEGVEIGAMLGLAVNRVDGLGIVDASACRGGEALDGGLLAPPAVLRPGSGPQPPSARLSRSGGMAEKVLAIADVLVIMESSLKQERVGRAHTPRVAARLYNWAYEAR